jgi:uncharacterized membrane protein
VTVARGVNDSGLIVGYRGKNPVFGFLYDGTTFTTIQHGSDSATYADGINNAGEVVGWSVVQERSIQPKGLKCEAAGSKF